jgi:hypothetical protein
MNRTMTRRGLISTAPVVLTAGILTGTSSAIARAVQPSDGDKPALWPGFPRQDAKLVSEVVGKAHADEARVRELVASHPALVNACWDWGFGDFETPLGAASHTGQRGIAEFLLERGARIDIFAAAMLGLTDVVKAFVAARPGIQRTLGPHGITLLAHAKAGEEKAADTVAYLTSLGDADVGHQVEPLPADRQEVFLGKYASAETAVRLECRVNKAGKLVIEIQQAEVVNGNRVLFYCGGDEFFTSGVPGVRLRFTVEGGKAQSVTIRGTDLDLTAKRVGG